MLDLLQITGFERFVEKLGNDSVRSPDYQRKGSSLDEHIGDIAPLDLQIKMITSFVETVQLLQFLLINSK